MGPTLWASGAPTYAWFCTGNRQNVTSTWELIFDISLSSCIKHFIVIHFTGHYLYFPFCLLLDWWRCSLFTWLSVSFFSIWALIFLFIDDLFINQLCPGRLGSDWGDGGSGGNMYTHSWKYYWTENKCLKILITFTGNWNRWIFSLLNFLYCITDAELWRWVIWVNSEWRVFCGWLYGGSAVFT